MVTNPRFIAVSSACGGVGTSSLAVALGRVLTRLYERKVLYVSFDFLADKSMMQGGAGRRDFLEYYQKTIQPNGSQSIDFIKDIVTDFYGLDYFKCDEGINPLNFNIDNLPEFIMSLNMNYDALILDVPCSNITGLKLFPVCEDIVVNYGISRPHQKKYCDNFTDFLGRVSPQSVLHRFSCGFDEFSFRDGDVDIHGEFGAEVRKLAEEIGI